MEKIPSGIDGFDDVLFGGFPCGRTYLISGEPGTGKTIFSLQYLLEGTKRGDRGIYITIDEKPEQIIENAKTLGWDIHGLLKSQNLEFLDITAYFGSRKMLAERLNYDRIVDNIISFIEDKKATRVVIDPISPLIFAVQPNPDVAYYIRKLVFKLEELGQCTTLMTSPIPVGSNYLSKNGLEEFLTSGVLLLKLQKINYKFIRSIIVKKMRGTPVDLTEYSFEILSERGIVLRQPI